MPAPEFFNYSTAFGVESRKLMEDVRSKLQEFDRPISENNSNIGVYANCRLSIYIEKGNVILLMGTTYKDERFSNQMCFNTSQFNTFTRQIFDNMLNTMYLQIGKMMEEYNRKGELSK